MSFKSALQKYEGKKYEECFEELEKVLERQPKQGEAWCLKGLCSLNLKRENKGGDFVKKGLELSPDSSIAWHIGGIWYKMEKDYKNAYHAYCKSYLLDQDNINVQQDLGMLAMNERNWKLLVEVRRRFLRSRPQQHVAWTSLAVAQYKAGDYAGAQQTLKLYLDLLANERAQRITPLPPVKDTAEKIDTSETLLFLNKVIASSGDYKAALDHLEEIKDKVLDKLAYSTKKAEYLTALGSPKAANAWLDLVHRNPNCLEYYQQIEDLVSIDTVAKKTKFYAGIRKAYPKAEVPQQRPLFFLEGKELEEYLLQYLNDKIAAGVPSIFSLVKPLYRSGNVMDAVIPKLKATDSLAYNLFMAKHLSLKGDQEAALKHAEAAGDVAEAQLAKAKILTRMGDFAAAAKLAKDVSDADKGDRFLNTKAVKYAILAGDFDSANSIAADFPTRTKENKDGLKYMVDLEAVNFLTKIASGYSLHSDHMMALKRANNTINIFDTCYNHQYDFHYYGPRRGTLRSYCELVDWVDTVYAHPVYEEAVKVAINEYVAYATGTKDGIPAEDKEKLLKERKAAQETAQKEKEAQKDSSDEIDLDPWGVTYSTPKDPLESAIKAWKPLSEARPTNARTWKLVFPVYLAQKKYVIAVQALKKAKEYGASESWIAAAGVSARHALENDEAAPAPIRTLQTKMLATICQGDLTQDLVKYTDEHVTDDLEWAQTRALLNKLDGVESRFIKNLAKYDTVQLQDIYLYLRRWGLGTEFGKAVLAKHPKTSFVK